MMRGTHKAFTLIEMLIGIILLTLLIGVALFAFRMQLLSIHKMKTSSIESIRTYANLKNVLVSMDHYVVDTYDTLGKPMERMHYFFYGDTTQLLTISTNPILSTEKALVKLECISHRLVYTEEPLFHRINYLQPSIQSDSQQLVLYDHLKQCAFSYLSHKGVWRESMTGRIPQGIIFSFESTEQPMRDWFFPVRSDDNSSLMRVHDATYPDI